MAFCSNIDQMAKFGGYILPNMRAALLLTYGSGIAARMANCGPRRPEWRSSPIAFMNCTTLSPNGCKTILDHDAVNAFGGTPEERRVGEAFVVTCRYGWGPSP